MDINFVFPLKIEPKLRARQGKHGWYTPTKTADCENMLKFYAKRQLPEGFEIIKEKAIEMNITFFLLKSKNIPKKRTLPIVRPDLDNYIKLICDSMNGIIWKDDGLIWKITATKLYGTKDEVFMWVIY